MNDLQHYEHEIGPKERDKILMRRHYIISTEIIPTNPNLLRKMFFFVSTFIIILHLTPVLLCIKKDGQNPTRKMIKK